jgi:hypothetical protein
MGNIIFISRLRYLPMQTHMENVNNFIKIQSYMCNRVENKWSAYWTKTTKKLLEIS